jgi:sarcosine oxidase gamma subunit
VTSVRAVDVAVVNILADPPAIDACERHLAEGRCLRTAADELLIVAAPRAAEAVRRSAEEVVSPVDGDALVMDVSDGWAAWRLEGDDARATFARLSTLELPPDGWIQGDIARVAAKAIAEHDRILILAPSYWRDHLRTRILTDTATTEVSA